MSDNPFPPIEPLNRPDQESRLLSAAARIAHLRRRAVLAALAAVALVVAVVLPIALTGHSGVRRLQVIGEPSTTSTPATTASTAPSPSTFPPRTSSTTVQKVPLPGPVAVPVVKCPTTYGYPGEEAGLTLPATITLRANPTVASQLEYYSNDTRTVTPVLGPKGWACRAILAADGSAGISIYPPDQPLRGTSAGQPDIDASSAGGCQSCVYIAVCPFAPTAVDHQYPEYASIIHCPARPSGESVYWIKGSPNSATTDNPDVIAYSNPTTPNQTNGVVLYTVYTSATGGSTGSASGDLCTLPSNEHQLCTVILNDFISKDWRMP